MEYITSGDRIAVENFEIGSIYKVTFLNETEVYFMCCGKGKDFVMMMSNEPRLFSLTMLSAAEVTAIDDYTPLPPPTPPTNLLQYQTGEPPFTFTTTDTELFSWYIKGPAGDKTANLFDTTTYYEKCVTTRCTKALLENEITITATGNDPYVGATCNIGATLGTSHIPSLTPVTPNTTYTLSLSSAPKCFISMIGNDYVGTELFKSIPSSDTQTSYTFTTGESTYYILLRLGKELQTGESYSFSNIMLNSGSEVPYEPYGQYKIPILCNTTLSNIYINEALGENDILYSTDTTYTIATELGDNLLQVGGETQPSEMQIVYKWEFKYE